MNKRKSKPVPGTRLESRLKCRRVSVTKYDNNMYRIVFKRLMARHENPKLSLKERLIVTDFYLTEEAYKSFITLYMLLNSKSRVFIMPKTEKTTAFFQGK